jgi:hypothetical protein
MRLSLLSKMFLSNQTLMNSSLKRLGHLIVKYLCPMGHITWRCQHALWSSQFCARGVLDFQSVKFNPNKIYTMKLLSMFNGYLSKLKLLLGVVPKVLKLSHTLSNGVYSTSLEATNSCLMHCMPPLSLTSNYKIK